MQSIVYNGQDIRRAAYNRDFPLVVLLWGMAAANGTDLIVPDEYGNTPIHFAAASGCIDILVFLLDQIKSTPALQDAVNHAGETPLLRAAHRGHMSIVKTLVEYGSDKNVPDENGHTAIHHAAANGHLLVLHYLQTGSTFHELFYWPIVKDHIHVVHYLRARTVDQNMIHYLKYTKNQPRMDTLLTASNLPPLEDTLTNERHTKTRIKVLVLYAVPTFGLIMAGYFILWYIVLGGYLLLGYFLFRKKKPTSGTMEYMPPKDTLERSEISKNKSWNQPESAAGFWLGWMLAFLFIDISSIMDRDWSIQQSISVIALNGLLGILWSMLCLFSKDAGSLRLQNLQQVLDEAELGNELSPTTCYTCLIDKPPRSKHCRHCKRCIRRMDHHYLRKLDHERIGNWINNCIGYGNHRTFIVFLLVHLSALVVHAVILYQLLEDAGEDEELKLISHALENNFVIVVMFLWSIVASLFITHLLYDQLKNMVQNFTVNERLHWRRYSYTYERNDQGELVQVNKYNVGLVANLISFWWHTEPKCDTNFVML